MSIQDLFHQIKERLPSRAGELSNVEVVEFNPDGSIASHTLLDRFFLSLVIILVAGGSFGLGKLSGAGERPPIEIRYEEMGSANGTISTQTANTLNAVQTSGSKVVVSKSGSKYHYLDCSGAKRIKEENKIFFPSAEAAEAAGYTLAGNCQKR